MGNKIVTWSIIRAIINPEVTSLEAKIEGSWLGTWYQGIEQAESDNGAETK